MITATVQPIPLACVPGAIPAAERQAHFQLSRELFASQCEARNDTEGGTCSDSRRRRSINSPASS
jgi:hypothetical protein